MVNLPKPLSQRPTGMPQMRRKSGLRTAAGNVQGAFLDRVRAVRDDPLLLLPTIVGEEPRELARLRQQLERAKDGKLGFFERRDKGLLGAAWACRAISERAAVPRLLDARIDGERRFYLPAGHVRKPCCLGVQNWDDPLALLLAYEQMAEALCFFAGEDLWCTGPAPVLPPEWVAGLAKRLEVELVTDGPNARCAHPERAALAHVVQGAGAAAPTPEVRLCRSCARPGTGGHLASRMRNPGGRRPYALQVLLPDGSRSDVAPEADALYRVGRAGGADLVDPAVAKWHGGLGGRFAAGDRLFATQDDFLDHLDAPAWMRPALAAMTAGGHAGPDLAVADLLAEHRDALAAGIRALGADPDELARRHPEADGAALLRLAHEAALRGAKTADLPPLPAGAGPLAQWIDGFVRSRRTDGEPAALAKVRREAARLPHKAHVAAFVAACGADPAMGTGFGLDTKEAGLGLSPLAKDVLGAAGPAYLGALAAYLEQSGSGETLG
jgi:hypothetical protein